MKHSLTKRTLCQITILCVALFALAALSIARTRTLATSVNIVNNSGHEIRSIYLSHVDTDDWSGNQLGSGSVIGSGQSFNLGNVTCDQQQVKIIGEDEEGCFISTVVACGSNSTWTISSDAARDCGN